MDASISVTPVLGRPGDNWGQGEGEREGGSSCPTAELHLHVGVAVLTASIPHLDFSLSLPQPSPGLSASPIAHMSVSFPRSYDSKNKGTASDPFGNQE